MPGFCFSSNKCSGDSSGLDENYNSDTAYSDARFPVSACQEHAAKQPQGHQPTVVTFCCHYCHRRAVCLFSGFYRIVFSSLFLAID